MINSIKNKLLAYLTGIILFLSLTIGLSSYLLMNKYLTKIISDELALAAQITSTSVGQYIEQKKNILERVGQGPVLEEYVFKYKPLPMLRYLSKFRREFPLLSYINEDGQEELKVIKGVESDQFRNIGNQLYFQDALWTPGKAVISPAEFNSDLKEPVINVALAIYNYFGDTFMGILNASLPLSQLAEITEKTPIGKSGFVSLIDKKGTVLIHPEKSNILQKIKGKGENRDSIISKLTALESGTARAHILGIDGFVSYAPVKGHHFSVMVTLPYEEFIADLNAYRNRVFMLALLSIIIMGLMAMVISKRFTDPIVELSRASLDVSEGNFSRTINIHSKDETGMLARSFNQMISHIQAFRYELIAEKEYSENIMASMNDALFILNPRGSIKKISGATCRFSGYSEEELIGKQISFLIDGMKTNECNGLFQIPFQRGEELQLIRKDGIKVPVNFSVSMILDNKKRTQDILCVAHNITERKQWEESLLSLKKAIETVQLGITISDVDRNIVYINRAEAKMHGYEVDELFGKKTSIFAPPEIHDKVNSQNIKHFKQRHKESVNIRKNGSAFPVLLRSDIILNDDGEPLGIITTCEDITERKKEEKEAQLRRQQLIHADKMKSLGVLVSGVAHEINNPNNFIRLNSQTLKEIIESLLPVLEESGKDKDDYLVGYMTFDKASKKLYELMDGIIGGSMRIEGIVSKLKDFARQDTFDYTEDVDINKVAKGALSMMENMIKKSTDRFLVNYGEKLPLIEGNELELEQVIINLLSNACQALTGREKEISLSTLYDKPSKTVKIIVSDEGIGMSGEIIGRIEEPFVTSKREQGGLGLGLSVSSAIIRNHGGKMEFASKSGEGTVATLTLPLARNKDMRKEI
ncbi:MAG: PAS domain S-box protein [Deltaproteobacteria bacterium]|nr:PAS domain S-box protein [Deltaproteobacteria bacterium]